ncbi:MAG: hypothetical protein CVV41_12920 [Candidatus Riflebacteria bacterium HGW-Riflebacteria-1]|nr:MAG: hypothetical protein CVV41_12920 [Candidatus Riflebacteria bacterium HGW-Riflebacteria-1]
MFFICLTETGKHLKSIDSKSNALVKKALRISSGKAHEADPLLVVEGFKLIDEALKSGARLQMCFVCEAELLIDRPEIASRAILVPRNLLRELTTVQTPGSVIAYFDPVSQQDADVVLTRSSMVIVLDRIQDPGNLGTIMRTGEALGADAIIMLKGCCSQYNPKAIRAAMGSSFRLPTINAPDHTSAIELLKRHGFTCLATGMHGKKLPEFSFPSKSAIFFGQEGQGLDEQIFSECTVTLAIPMQGQVESLNVATSVAVCLYEWARAGSSRNKPG